MPIKANLEHSEYDIGDLSLYATIGRLGSSINHDFDDLLDRCSVHCRFIEYPMPDPLDQVMCKLVERNGKEMKVCRTLELPIDEQLKARSIFASMFQKNSFSFPIYDTKQSSTYTLNPKTHTMINGYIREKVNQIKQQRTNDARFREETERVSLLEELRAVTEIRRNYPSDEPPISEQEYVSIPNPSGPFGGSKLSPTQLNEIFRNA